LVVLAAVPFPHRTPESAQRLLRKKTRSDRCYLSLSLALGLALGLALAL
jgi:hypothetical protein